MWIAEATYPAETSPTGEPHTVTLTAPTARDGWRLLAELREGEVAERGGGRPDRTARELRRIADSPEPFVCADQVRHDPDGPGAFVGPPVGPVVAYRVAEQQ